MKIEKVLEYKLKGERNVRPRIPLIYLNNLFLIFVYDKKGFCESKVLCLNTQDFSLVWEYTHPHVINNLVLSESGSLMASCMNGEILNFNIEDGSVKWRFTTGDGNIGSISSEVNARIICTGIQGNKWMWCLHTKDGEVLWSVKTKGHSYQPYIFERRVLNSIEHELTCLDLESGETIWTVNEPKSYLFNPIVVRNIVIASGHGLINFYNVETGKLLSSIYTKKSTKGGSIWKVIADDTAIYFGDEDGNFFAYSFPKPTASFLGFLPSNKSNLNWKIETKGGIESVPAVFDESILVINNGNQFLNIDKRNGHILQEMKTKGAAYISGVTVVNKQIFYSCYGGYIVKCIVKDGYSYLIED